jgi:CRISPR-associated exonuclease Cas4
VNTSPWNDGNNPVISTPNPRSRTEKAAKRVHELIKAGKTTKPVYSKKCDSCSFVGLCLPKTIEKNRSVNRYLKNAIQKL